MQRQMIAVCVASSGPVHVRFGTAPYFDRGGDCVVFSSVLLVSDSAENTACYRCRARLRENFMSRSSSLLS